jgi:hypothetical protein
LGEGKKVLNFILRIQYCSLSESQFVLAVMSGQKDVEKFEGEDEA